MAPKAKNLFIWISVTALALAAIYILISWLVNRQFAKLADASKLAAKPLADMPLKEIGFHAIMKQHAAAT